MISIKSDFMICAFRYKHPWAVLCLSAIYLLYKTFPRTESVISCNSTITSDIILQMHKSNSIKQNIPFLIKHVLQNCVYTYTRGLKYILKVLLWTIITTILTDGITKNFFFYINLDKTIKLCAQRSMV